MSRQSLPVTTESIAARPRISSPLRLRRKVGARNSVAKRDCVSRQAGSGVTLGRGARGAHRWAAAATQFGSEVSTATRHGFNRGPRGPHRHVTLARDRMSPCSML